MNVLELLSKRIEKLKASIKPEMTADELNTINADIKEFEDMKKEYEAMHTANEKYKSTILDLVTSTGTKGKEDDNPSNGASSEEPKSLEEMVQSACDTKDKGGK